MSYASEALMYSVSVRRYYHPGRNPFRGIFDDTTPNAWAAFKGNVALQYLGLYRYDAAEYADWLELMLGLSSLTDFEWEEVRDNWLEWERHGDSLGDGPFPFIKILVADIDRFDDAAKRLDGRNRLIRTALALEQFHAQRMQFPDMLHDLVPDYLSSVPLDPYDGQSIRYRRLDNGYTVYSIWRDEEDDGGVSERDGIYNSVNLDCVLTITRPDLQTQSLN